MKRNHGIKIVLAVFFVIIISLIFTVSGNLNDIGAEKTIKADVKSIHLNTEINFYDTKTEELLFTAKGNYIRIVTDPLTLYDENGETKLGYASDEFHLISQDSHVIYTNNGERNLELVGAFQIFGDKYDIYVGENLVARAEFNPFNTYGTIKDVNGNIIADYTSRLMFNDFTIQITNNNLFSDEELALIFASYYSDQKYDSNRNSSSHNNSK